MSTPRKAPVTSKRVSKRLSTSSPCILMPANSRTHAAFAASSYTRIPYVIFYAATDDEVVIHGLRHAARRPSSMPD